MRIAILLLFALFSAFAGAQDKPKDPPAASKPSDVKQLTPLGTMAFRALAPEIEKVQADLQVFRDSELKAQGLDPKEWDIRFDLTPGKERAEVVRIYKPETPDLPAKPEEPKKKPEVVKPASTNKGQK